MVNTQVAGCAKLSGATLVRLFQQGWSDWDGLAAALSDTAKIELLDVETLSRHNFSLRRYVRPNWIKVTSAKDFEAAKVTLIGGAQKGSLDLPAERIHAPLENAAINWLSETRATPNQVTLVTNIAAWLITGAILSGFLWWGMFAAAAVCIMDGLDGKLARVKLMTSKLGEFEHIFDMLFEYSWWLSLGWVIGGQSVNSFYFVAGLVLVVVSFVDHLIAVVFWFGLGRRYQRTIDNFTPFDLGFRKIAGRRNIYVWMLLLFGPVLGWQNALLACMWWGVITISVRGGRSLWLIISRQSPAEFCY